MENDPNVLTMLITYIAYIIRQLNMSEIKSMS